MFPEDPSSLSSRGRGRVGAYHGHAVDRLLLPCRERRRELHVVVLQHAKAERTEGVIRTERSAVGEINLHSTLRRRNNPNGRVQPELTWVEELLRFRLYECLEAAFVYRK